MNQNHYQFARSATMSKNRGKKINFELLKSDIEQNVGSVNRSINRLLEYILLLQYEIEELKSHANQKNATL